MHLTNVAGGLLTGRPGPVPAELGVLLDAIDQHTGRRPTCGEVSWTYGDELAFLAFVDGETDTQRAYTITCGGVFIFDPASLRYELWRDRVLVVEADGSLPDELILRTR